MPACCRKQQGVARAALEGLYAAGSGLRAAYQAEQVLANDAANASTSGFMESIPGAIPWNPMMEAVTGAGGPLPLGTLPGGTAGKTVLDQTPGALDPSRNTLSMGLGALLVSVRTPGGVRYSRAGSYLTNAAGQIVTPAGYPVLDRAGRPVQVTPGARFTATGSVVSANGKVLGQVALYMIGAPVNVGGGLVMGAARLAPATARVVPLATEESNVNLSVVTSDLILAQRALQADAQAIQAENAAAQQAEQQVG